MKLYKHCYYISVHENFLLIIFVTIHLLLLFVFIFYLKSLFYVFRINNNKSLTSNTC